MQDSAKTLLTPTAAGNPLEFIWSFLSHQYFTNPAFWACIFLVLFLMFVARVFIFDNKNLKINATSWGYPAIFLFIVLAVSWLEDTGTFAFSRAYFSNLLVTCAGVFTIYTAFGHKLLIWLSSLVPFGKDDEKLMPKEEPKV